MAPASALVAAAALCALAGCSMIRPAPQIITRTDTVTVTKEVAAALPNGDTVEVCLSNGMPARVLVGARGDTLIGDARVPLKAVQPLLTFAGTYAADRDWYQQTDTLRFEKRLYRRTGPVVKRACDELKLVGEYGGVSLFADVTAAQKLPMLVVPVRPGLFQVYSVRTTSKR